MKPKRKEYILPIILFLLFSIQHLPIEAQYRAVKKAENKKERQERKEERTYQKMRQAFVKRHLSLQTNQVRKQIINNWKTADKEMARQWKKSSRSNTSYTRKVKKSKREGNIFYLY